MHVFIVFVFDIFFEPNKASGTTDFSLTLSVYGTVKAALDRFTKMTAADGVKNTGIRKI